ncbi:MAG: DUF2313 domain-containing protein [Ruminococcaceae bacterium]|nr:DUF2313 domain-containing protein [Oscillospiraceae bacterium]
MGYTDYLIRILAPLSVYDLTENSYSRAELEAMGKALDECCSEIEILERECTVPTAEDYGLSMYEKLLPRHYAIAVHTRRKAIISMLSVNNSCFTQELLNKTLSGCGEPTTVRETGEASQVMVDFTEVNGRPVNYVQLERWVENMLPCHLETVYNYEVIESQNT